jgi:hypothetical protein
MIPVYEPCSKQPGVEPAREWNNDRPTIGDPLEPIECGLESGLQDIFTAAARAIVFRSIKVSVTAWPVWSISMSTYTITAHLMYLARNC